MSGMVIWITGLPGSGKSTVADEIRKAHPEFTILRMDEIRRIATPQPTYSDIERDILYRALVFFARKLSELGHRTIIDATGNLRTWRELARQVIPVYREVYLRCAKGICILREQERVDRHEAPGDIYKKGIHGWLVPGMAAPYEEPFSPEVTIDTDKTGVKEAVEIIAKALLTE